MDKNVQLTGREARVLRLIAGGCTYTQVAARLGAIELRLLES
jgi:DNA-binding CsgD family transcriptional regulator